MCIKVFKICIALCQYLFLVSSNNEKFLWEMRILKYYFLHKVDKNEARIWSDFCKKKISPQQKKNVHLRHGFNRISNSLEDI